MFGTTLILIARELVGPVKSLIEAAIAQDEERAKHALVDVMLAGKRVALKKARGG